MIAEGGPYFAPAPDELPFAVVLVLMTSIGSFVLDELDDPDV